MSDGRLIISCEGPIWWRIVIRNGYMFRRCRNARVDRWEAHWHIVRSGDYIYWKAPVIRLGIAPLRRLGTPRGGCTARHVLMVLPTCRRLHWMLCLWPAPKKRSRRSSFVLRGTCVRRRIVRVGMWRMGSPIIGQVATLLTLFRLELITDVDTTTLATLRKRTVFDDDDPTSLGAKRLGRNQECHKPMSEDNGLADGVCGSEKRLAKRSRARRVETAWRGSNGSPNLRCSALVKA